MMLPPPPWANHLPRRRLTEMEHAGQIDRDDALPLIVVEVEKAPAMADPGAVEQHVEPAELAHRRCHRSIDRRPVAHIEWDRGSPAAGGANSSGGGFGRGGIDVGADDRCALTSEALRAGAADAAAGPCHEGDFPFNAIHLDPPGCFRSAV